MNFILNFLINIITFIKNFFKQPDYKIISVDVEYLLEDGEYVTTDDFWENQSKQWDDATDYYIARLNNNDTVPEPPAVVAKTLFRIKYFYNNRVYKYLTYDRNYKWPPEDDKSMVFKVPLRKAYLMDKNGNKVRDVLRKIKRYTGNHICENVKISDMFYYSEDALKESFPKVYLEDIFGETKTVSTVDGYITDLQIPWSPDKISNPPDSQRCI